MDRSDPTSAPPRPAVPTLHPGRSVTAGLPPPAVKMISAMMDGGDFAELKRVDHKTHVAVRSEPNAVMLEGGFVAIASAPRMAADVESGREFDTVFDIFGQIEVASDIKMGTALEMELLDAEPFFTLDYTRDLGLQRGALRQRP